MRGESGLWHVPIGIIRSVISEMGGNALYTEIRHDDDVGGLVGRIACRQHNEVNDIFSMINVPLSYAMTFGTAILVEDTTILESALDTAEEVSDMIGVDIEKIGVENGKET